MATITIEKVQMVYGTQNGSNYVAQIGDVKYESLADANKAAQSGETIKLLVSELDEDLPDSLKAGVTLEGADGGTTISGKQYGKRFTDNVVKNIVFSNPGGFGVYTTQCYGVTFEDCTFNAGAYGIHFDAFGKDASFINCKLYGWNSFTGNNQRTLTFAGCLFDLGPSYYGDRYAELRPFSNAIMTNCILTEAFIENGPAVDMGIDLGGHGNVFQLNGCQVVDADGNVSAKYTVEDALNAIQYDDSAFVLNGVEVEDGKFSAGTIIANIVSTVKGLVATKSIDFIPDDCGAISYNINDGAIVINEQITQRIQIPEGFAVKINSGVEITNGVTITLANEHCLLEGSNVAIGPDSLIMINVKQSESTLDTPEKLADWKTARGLDEFEIVRFLAKGVVETEKTRKEDKTEGKTSLTITDTYVINLEADKTLTENVEAPEAEKVEVLEDTDVKKTTYVRPVSNVIVNSKAESITDTTEVRGKVEQQSETCNIIVNNYDSEAQASTGNVETKGAHMEITGELKAANKIIINNGNAAAAQEAIINGGSDERGFVAVAKEIEMNNYGHAVTNLNADKIVIHNNSLNTIKGKANGVETLIDGTGRIEDAVICAVDDNQKGELTISDNQTIINSILTADSMTNAGAITMDYSTITVNGAFNNNGTVCMDYTSKIAFGSYTGNTITINTTGYTSGLLYKVLDFTGTGATPDYNTIVDGGIGGDTKYHVLGGDLFYGEADMSVIAVNEYWGAGKSDAKEYGDSIVIGDKTYYYGINAFDQMASFIGDMTGGTIIAYGNGNVAATATTVGEGIEINKPGTYNLSGTEWTDLGYLQLNSQKTVLTDRILVNIKDSNLVARKIQARRDADYVIENSHLDFKNDTPSRGYTCIYANSTLTITNSVYGYNQQDHTGNSNAIIAGREGYVENQIKPTDNYGKTAVQICGKLLADNSTLFTVTGDDKIGFGVFDKGYVELKDSVLYAGAVAVGVAQSDAKKKSQDTGVDVATMVFDNSILIRQNADNYKIEVGRNVDAALIIRNGSLIDRADAPMTVTSGSSVEISGSTVKLASLTNAGAITMDAASTITVTGAVTNTGTISVDMTGATAGVYKLIDAGAASNYGTYSFATDKAFGYTFSVVDNDLWAINASTSTVLVDTAFSTYSFGDAIADREGYYFGINAFDSIYDGFSAVDDGGKVLFNSSFTDTEAVDDYDYTKVITIDAYGSDPVVVNWPNGEFGFKGPASASMTRDNVSVIEKNVTLNADFIGLGDYGIKSAEGPANSFRTVLMVNGTLAAPDQYCIYPNGKLHVTPTGKISGGNNGGVLLWGDLEVAGAAANKQQQLDLGYVALYGNKNEDGRFGGHLTMKDTIGRISGPLTFGYPMDTPPKTRHEVQRYGELSLDSSILTIGSINSNAPNEDVMAGSHKIILTNGSLLTVNSTAVFSANMLVSIDNASQFAGNSLTNAGLITIDAASQITVNSAFNGADGTITVDMTDAGETGAYKLIDAAADSNFGAYTFADGKDFGYVLSVVDNDLWAINADLTTYKVNADWSDLAFGAAIEGHGGFYYGINAFSNLTDALDDRVSDTGKITLESDVSQAVPASKNIALTNDLILDGNHAFTGTVPGNATWQVYASGAARSFTLTEGTSFRLTDGTSDIGTGATLRFGDDEFEDRLTNVNIDGALYGDQISFDDYSDLKVSKTGTLENKAMLQLRGNVVIDGGDRSTWSADNAQVKVGTYLNIRKKLGEGRDETRTVTFKNTFVKIGPSNNLKDNLNVYEGANLVIDNTGVDVSNVLLVGTTATTATITLKSASTLKTHGDYSDNNKVFASSSLSITEGSSVTMDKAFENAGTITIDGTSSLYASNIANNGAITLAKGGVVGFENFSNGSNKVALNGFESHTGGAVLVMDYIGTGKTFTVDMYKELVNITDASLFRVFNNDLYFVGSTQVVYVNSNYRPDGDNDGHTWNVDAFADYDTAENMQPKKMVATGGTFNSATVAANGIELEVQTGDYSASRMYIFGGVKSGKGRPSKSWLEKTGDTKVTIVNGNFNNIVGADYVRSGSLYRKGNVTLAIEGGNFAGNVSGGMLYYQETLMNDAWLEGNIDLTISGGNFTGEMAAIYGGNICESSDYISMATLVQGNISITIDASTNAINVANIYAGSMGYGAVVGNTLVTLTGAAANLTNGLISGGSGKDLYYTNKHRIESMVTGKRALVFDAFSGVLNSKLFSFSDVTFKHGSEVTFGNDKSKVDTIENWTFEFGSSLEGLQSTNDFTGDTLAFTGLASMGIGETWDVISGVSEDSLKGFDNEANTVTFNGVEASFCAPDGWVANGYSLNLDETKTTLIVTRLS